MKARVGFREGLVFASLLFVAESPWAADAALVYKKNYQCGKEIVQVAYCRRDSDEPGMPATRDADNYCQVYYLDRPKNNLGGTAFGVELRGDLEKRLTACGALVAPQSAARPASQPIAKPATATLQPSGDVNAATAEYESAMTLAAAKNRAQAVEAYKRSIAILPTSAAWTGLGNTYLDLKRYQEATQAFQQALLIKPDNFNAAFGLGMSYKYLKQYDAAIAAFREALRLNPDFDDASYQAGNAWYESGKYDEAAASYRDAAQLKPGSALYRYNLGQAYYRLNRHQEAIVELNEALRIDPKYASALNALGNVHDALKKYPEAMDFYQRAIALLPKEAVFRCNIADTFQKMNRYDDSAAAYRECLRLDPNPIPPHNGLGIALYFAGHYDEALSEFRKALAASPTQANYLSNFGMTLVMLGRIEEARKVRQDLEKIDPASAASLQAEITKKSPPPKSTTG